MVLFKSCPRCQAGDLVEAEDMYGRYRRCVQCSDTTDMPREQAPRDVRRAQLSIDERMAPALRQNRRRQRPKRVGQDPRRTLELFRRRREQEQEAVT